jgi:RimJ/RimL family protein N-acetyltransferase
MKLSENNIRLVLFNHSDCDFFVEMTTCPKLMKHIYTPFTPEQAKLAFELKSQPWNFESDGWLTFSINDIKNNEKLGSIGLKVINHDAKIAEVGFIIKTSAQGKGVASIALKLLKEYAFTQLPLNKLVGYCSVHNLGSYKLLEKQGFIREGCLKQNSFANNQFVDDYVYGLCKSDI